MESNDKFKKLILKIAHIIISMTELKLKILSLIIFK